MLRRILTTAADLFDFSCLTTISALSHVISGISSSAVEFIRATVVWENAGHCKTISISWGTCDRPILRSRSSEESAPVVSDLDLFLLLSYSFFSLCCFSYLLQTITFVEEQTYESIVDWYSTNLHLCVLHKWEYNSLVFILMSLHNFLYYACRYLFKYVLPFLILSFATRSRSAWKFSEQVSLMNAVCASFFNV